MNDKLFEELLTSIKQGGIILKEQKTNKESMSTILKTDDDGKTVWRPNFVRPSEIIADYNSKSEEEKKKFTFLVGPQETQYVNIETNEVLYESQNFEVVMELLKDNCSIPYEMTDDLKEIVY